MILFLDTIPSSNSFCKSASRPRQFFSNLVQEIEVRDFRRRGLFVELTAAARKLHAQQNAFYGSEEWRNGPREAIVSRITSYLSTVLWLSPESIEDLRRLNASLF